MYIRTLLLTNTWQQHKGTNYAFCISLKWLSNAVFGKEIDVKFTLTKAYIRCGKGISVCLVQSSTELFGCNEMIWLKL